MDHETRWNLNRRATPLGIVLMVTASGCADPADPSHGLRSSGADPEAGRAAIERYDCGVCHTIPGIRGARGVVGPPLDAFSHRVYIAGKFSNRKEILECWIQDPPALAPETAMPNLGDTYPEGLGWDGMNLASREYPKAPSANRGGRDKRRHGPALDPLYEEAIRDTIERFEATGSPVITAIAYVAAWVRHS